MKRWISSNRGFIAFLFLFGVFRTAIADWSPIPTGSMRPGLLEGDVVFVNRVAFDLKLPLTDVILTRLGEPQRGDVVVFYSPTDRTRTIKRLMALPGDVLEMRAERLTINGVPASYEDKGAVDEPIEKGQTIKALRFDEMVNGHRQQIQIMPAVMAKRNFGPLRVPEGQFLMLGDNRDNSADSRYFGMVPRANLIGRAERILVSADITSNWMPRGDRFGMSLRRDVAVAK